MALAATRAHRRRRRLRVGAERPHQEGQRRARRHGRTRRILLSGHAARRIIPRTRSRSILAHELAHHVHRDLWRGIARAGRGRWLAGSSSADLRAARGRRVRSGCAACPIRPACRCCCLIGGVWSFLLMPLVERPSRARRSAPPIATRSTTTRNVDAFVTAMKRLSQQNLAEEYPSPLVRWLFYSHPPIRERIDAARRFRPRGIMHAGLALWRLAADPADATVTGSAQYSEEDRRRASRRVGLRARSTPLRGLQAGDRDGRRLRRAGSRRHQGRRADLPARRQPRAHHRMSSRSVPGSRDEHQPRRQDARAPGSPTTSRSPRSRRSTPARGSTRSSPARRCLTFDEADRADSRQGRDVSRAEDAGDLRRPRREIRGDWSPPRSTSTACAARRPIRRRR